MTKLYRGLITCILFIGIIVAMTNCGLPDYAFIEAPIPIDLSTESILAFQTPANINNIIGYMLYYKIYTGNSDYDETGDSDKDFFNPTKYTNDTIPAGDNVPKQRGFFKMGSKSNPYNLQKYIIAQDKIGGGGRTVYIDFRDLSENVEPAVYLNDNRKDPLAVLLRGVRDKRNSSQLLGFYNNWEFNEGDGDDYEDSDLLRNTNTSGLLKYQPVNTEDNYENIRKHTTPLSKHKEFPLTSPSDLHIAIAIHSWGQDFTSGKLQDITSIPVYLGYVIIPQVKDIDSTSR